MIPLKLHIKNFLSYGHTQTIDFSPYHLICLAGKNGHGKSALLDAMTWALWGQARKVSGTSKADHGLMRLGQTVMMVVFDFSFGSAEYRIKREFSVLYNKPQSILEFGLINREKNCLIPLTDKTIRATQEKIDTTIRLSYESFINSAFLRQGQSNEFSKKSPKERKEVLASILHLESFEIIRKRAQDVVRLSQQKYASLTMLNSSLDLHTQSRGNHEAGIISTAEQLAALSSEEQNLENENTTLADLKLMRNSLQQDIVRATADYAHLAKQYQENLLLLQDIRAKWKKNRADFSLLKKTELLRAEQEHYSREHKNHQDSYMQSLLFGNVILEVEAQIALCTQCMQLKQEAHELRTQQTIIQPHLARKNEILTEKEQIQCTRDRYSLCILQAKQMLEFCRKQQSIVQRQHDIIMAPHNSSCPVCEQSLPADRKNILNETTKAHYAKLSKRIARVQALLKAVELRIQDLNDRSIKNESTYSALLAHEKSYNDRTQKLELLEKQHSQLCGLSCASACYASLSAKRDTLYTQKKELAYNKETHEKIERTLATVTTQLNALPSSEAVEGTRLFLYEKAAHTCALLKKIKYDIQALAMLPLQADYDTLCKKIAAAQEQYKKSLDHVSQRKNDALAAHAYHTAELQKIDTLEKQMHSNTTEILALKNTISDYSDITAAAGKDGLQALIIEEALPEIEHEANALLSKLTQNNAHIMIESLRDLKKGGVKETLDIKISDSWGVRPYEMFSGGEAFRIDFALRIAISKLLARRAGTALQTLIIDEGFGSQDEEGLCALMDALHKIQDDFSKIIIVSHLNTMKDHFPVHFFIEKFPDGSRIQIHEQD